ncbi:MAG: hypothetical protein OXI24_15710 [Candidatus Poribacteria bacterium]|nr:hypothetical protein [Candidatus Poribacteria bacterium]
MEKLASLIIIIGTFLWLFSILVLEGRWQWQMFSALVLTVGIFCAHFWEELRDTDNNEEPSDE